MYKSLDKVYFEQIISQFNEKIYLPPTTPVPSIIKNNKPPLIRIFLSYFINYWELLLFKNGKQRQ